MTDLEAGQPWRILCVDDEQDILDILQLTLSMKYEVVTASDGLEAMQMLDLADPDFVICDIRMPNLDGFQTVEAIRDHPRFSDIPVFFLTAERGTEAARKGFASGCNLFLTKPFDPLRVMDNIAHFLDAGGEQPRTKRLTLDAVEKELARLKSDGASERGYDGKARIVVLIHDPDLLARYQAALSPRYECVPCVDPLNSIQKIFRYDPDIILLDPAMSGISGVGLAKMIHTNPKLRRIPLVMIRDPREPFDERVLPSITSEALLPAMASPSAIQDCIEQITARPQFVVHPKRASIESLAEEERMVTEDLKRTMAREERQEERRQKQYSRIQDFIDSNG